MRTTLTNPFEHAEAVALSDTVDIAMGVCRGFIADRDCSVKVTMDSGAEVTLAGLNKGVEYRFQVRRFWLTGTTASTQITAGK